MDIDVHIVRNADGNIDSNSNNNHSITYRDRHSIENNAYEQGCN